MSFCWVWSRSRSFCGDCIRSLRGVPVELVPVPLPLATTDGGTALIGERGVEGGSLTVLPEPGRSDRPAMEPDMGRRVGMAVIDSLRLLECVDVDCVKDLMVISSLLCRRGVAGAGCTLPLRVNASTGRASGCTLPLRGSVEGTGSFSFLIGEPSRIGAGIDEVCLCEDTAVRKGVRGGEILPRLSRLSRFFGRVESGLRGVCDDHEGALSANCISLRSLNEERRFLRGWAGTASLEGGTSPIVPRKERFV